LLQQGEVDLGIMGRPPKELATRAEPFAAHPHVFVAPPGHPISAIGHPPVTAIAQYPLIVREAASGTRALMDRFFADHRVEPRIAMEMPSNETIKQAVMAGMGLSFLSLHTTWNVVHMQSKLLSPAAEACATSSWNTARPTLPNTTGPGWSARRSEQPVLRPFAALHSRCFVRARGGRAFCSAHVPRRRLRRRLLLYFAPQNALPPRAETDWSSDGGAPAPR
jgi:DNA-binding transcriptional LysR family regulator